MNDAFVKTFDQESVNNSAHHHQTHSSVAKYGCAQAPGMRQSYTCFAKKKAILAFVKICMGSKHCIKLQAVTVVLLF